MNPVAHTSSQGPAIGIDSGASSLKWVVRDSAGGLHHGSALGANLQLLGWERYLDHLEKAITAACQASGASPEQIATIGCGLAGVDRPPEIRRLREWLHARLPALQGCWVGNDALPALRQGAGRLAGIILIAGTGSICIGATLDHRVIRVGGWGSALGDEGSGFWIGRRALVLACRMADGRRKPTDLLRAVLLTLELKDPISIIPWVADGTAGEFKRRVAALTPLVFKLARQGEPSAGNILKLAQAHLASHVAAAIHQLDQLQAEGQPLATGKTEEHWPVVCAGGLFEQNDDFFQALMVRLVRHDPRLRPTRLSEPAALGALALGQESAPDVKPTL